MSIHQAVIGSICLTVLLCAPTRAGQAAPLSHTPADSIPWVDSPDGRGIATIHGNRENGEHITLIRFPAGMKTPAHTHSSEYVGIIVAGAARHFEPGSSRPNPVLRAGSVYLVPARVPHISECLPGAECIFAIHQHFPFDRKIVE